MDRANIDIKPGKKIYFASDFHLGTPNWKTSLEREKKVVHWLDQCSKDAQEIFLVGDLFDFWFEYKYAVPKGFVRLLGKIAELSDKGIPVTLFTGNHDMWMFDYLPKELGVSVYKEPIIRQCGEKTLFIGHGDGLGPGDHGYKFIKRVFANKVCQWLFGWLHPNLGIRMANFWSRKSRSTTGGSDSKFLGPDKEFLVHFAKDYLKSEKVDYFIFGHRHLPLEIEVGENSTYINLGDWIEYFTFAEFDGQNVSLQTFKE